MSRALELVSEFRARGVRLVLQPDGRVMVSPTSKLTADELAEARSLRDAIADILRRPALDPADAAASTTWPSLVCAACGTTTATTFVELAPAPGGEPWWLCGPCWRGDQ